MLKEIRVVPLAAESLGVRSMCTYIETSDVRILFDAGVSLCPSRFGFPPHPKEYEALATCQKRILDAIPDVDVIALSHYHFDHHVPSFVDWFSLWSSAETAKYIYSGKLVLAKDHRAMINPNQRRRGWMFRRTGGKQARRLENADGRAFEFGETELKFSAPVFHGSKNTPLGWVLMVTVQCGDDKVLFAPDVQGPMHNPTLELILNEKPQLIIIGGPPLYLTGFKVSEDQIQRGMKNLKAIVENVPLVILEHHILREERWRELSKPIFEAASKSGHMIATAAEFVRKKNNLLELQRKKLFENEPPSSEFRKWLKLPLPKRKLIRPPIARVCKVGELRS